MADLKNDQAKENKDSKEPALLDSFLKLEPFPEDVMEMEIEDLPPQKRVF